MGKNVITRKLHYSCILFPKHVLQENRLFVIRWVHAYFGLICLSFIRNIFHGFMACKPKNTKLNRYFNWNSIIFHWDQIEKLDHFIYLFHYFAVIVYLYRKYEKLFRYIGFNDISLSNIFYFTPHSLKIGKFLLLFKIQWK